ncbi:MAG: hypothetical protein KGP35_02720 [Bacteroidetes bacterium]|nr:hypothetical protein [Bacteroidota bacterium]
MRSFAYAQDDATEMCGAGKAERAERSSRQPDNSVADNPPQATTTSNPQPPTHNIQHTTYNLQPPCPSSPS